MKSDFFGYSAKLALAVLVVFSTIFASCYEKEEVDMTTVPPAAYYVVGSISDGSNGQPLTTATVKVDGTAVTLKDGAFIMQVPTAGAHSIAVTATGYYDVTKTVYCVVVADGQTSVAVADIAMFTPASQTTDPVREPEAPTTVELEKVKAELATKFIPTTPPAGTTMGASTAVVNNDGTVTVSTPLTLNTPTVDPITVSYSYKEGFELMADPIKTKAVSPIEQFKENVSKYLNKSEGFTEVSKTAVLNEGGKSITGYKLEYTINLEKFTFMIAGEEWSGLATWLSSFKVIAIVDTHDSHDNHGGGSSNAGGGAGGAE